MSLPNIAQYALFLLIILVLVKPVGGYLARVFARESTFLDPVLRPVERLIYRLTGVDEQREMNARQYLTAFVLFSLVGTLLLYLILRLQTFLPWYDAAHQPMGNMEGKEVRFGVGGSVLTAVTTSNGATGSTNSMHDSYTPLGGMVPVLNMLLGEMIFGGLGTGIYSIVMVALVGLFLTGLMIGRTPEYLGKRIEPSEMKLLAIYTLLGPIIVLLFAGLTVIAAPGLAGLTTNTGAHGLTTILNAYASSFANNGQTFAGLSANSLFYNVMTAMTMLIGRFGLAFYLWSQ